MPSRSERLHAWVQLQHHLVLFDHGTYHCTVCASTLLRVHTATCPVQVLTDDIFRLERLLGVDPLPLTRRR